MGVTMRIRTGVRPKKGAPRIVIARKITGLQFKNAEGKTVIKLTNSFSITHPQKEG